MHLHFEGQMDKRCYNLPTTSEIVVLLYKDDEWPQGMEDIVLQLKRKNNNLECINDSRPAYLLLHYMLLFLYGKLGWYVDFQYFND
jgi:hypothetical protein